MRTWVWIPRARMKVVTQITPCSSEQMEGWRHQMLAWWLTQPVYQENKNRQTKTTQALFWQGERWGPLPGLPPSPPYTPAALSIGPMCHIQMRMCAHACIYVIWGRAWIISVIEMHKIVCIVHDILGFCLSLFCCGRHRVSGSWCHLELFPCAIKSSPAPYPLLSYLSLAACLLVPLICIAVGTSIAHHLDWC